MPSGIVSQAVIIAVGSELLTPDRLDTNSLFVTRTLNELGISVRYKTVVSDDCDDVGLALKSAIRHAELVVVTGGLGPTDDDITREAISNVFDLPLEEDSDIAVTIRSLFKARGLAMPEINLRQALVPRGAIQIPNAWGTAPGLWIDHPTVKCLALPGPPRELEPMFERIAQDRIAPLTEGRSIFRRVIVIAGRNESSVDDIVCPIYSRWRSAPVPIRTTILASLGQIELHLSVVGKNKGEATIALDCATEELLTVLGKDLVSIDGARLEDVVGSLLCDRGYQVTVAESCTGGLVTSRLTDVPGSSAYVRAGWVVYSNDAKVEILGIDREIIEKHGAVSEPVARAMALQARARARVDYAIGVTGIAGPGGGSSEKPVGTVYLSLAGPEDQLWDCRLNLPGERGRVKYQASQAALDMLRRALLE